MTNKQNTAKRVLISGGGIAGLALGFWLERMGMEAVMIDRAQQFLPLGHYITLKGNGVDVLRQMGLLDQAHACESHLSQVQIFDASGRPLRKGSTAEFDQTLAGYIAFRRSDLHKVLYEAVKGTFDIRYGTELSAVHQTDGGVSVKFSTGATEDFDLLIGADGIHSRAREVVFGEGFEYPMGGLYIAMTVEYPHKLPVGHVRSLFGLGQSVHLMPTAETVVSAVGYHGDGGLVPSGQDPLSLKSFLLEAYAEYSPEVLEVFQALNDNSFIFSDKIAMVKMPVIVNGTTALVGDAAHCPTFMSGMGSSLALQGAQIMGQSLDRFRSNHKEAFALYERQIGLIAKRYQSSANKMREFILGRSPLVEKIRNFTFRITPDWSLQRRIQQFFHAEAVSQKRLAEV